MNDFAAVLAPKSDQINAQDLLGGDMTITITGVKVTPGTEQPVSITFQGSGKVWRPCKTTGRILMAAWGADTSIYPGRSVQLYLDPKVKWGGLEVGGIRIRAMSHIDEDLRIVVAESKQVRKPITVKRLATQQPAAQQPQGLTAADAIAKAKSAANKGTEAFRAWFNSEDGKNCRHAAAGALDPKTPALSECAVIAQGADNLAARMADDPFSQPTATDLEIEALIRAEQAARDAELEGRA